MKSDIFSYKVHDDIAVITIDSPPVNALGVEVRKSIVAGIERADADANVKAIILSCAGRTFHAGADIREFGKPPMRPSLRETIEVLEATEKLTVAAMHGTALGGGLELALGCHRRISKPTAKVGLPEVHLGILPGAGGTQKLPRVVGAKRALEIICSGRMVGANEAYKLGIIDKLCESDELMNEAISYTQSLIASNETIPRVRNLVGLVEQDRNNADLFDDFRTANAAKFRGLMAQESIIQSVQAAINLPFEEGMLRERELIEKLMQGPQSGALRHVFFAERETSKIPDIPKDTPTREIKNVAVIGAGTMGGGIAMNFLNAGLSVTLMERQQEALDRGINVIRSNYQRSQKRGKLNEQQLEDRMSLIKPTLDINELSDADLIIEAVFEEMSIKKQIFSELDKIAKENCILASNTSYLDIDEIAKQTSRPQDVIGMHFFSPANVMPLLEVVRGANSSIDAINTAMRLSKLINKTPVLSRACTGFIANRVMTVRAKQAGNMILQGISPEVIDRVVFDYGFVMGPFAMRDLIGLDVVNRAETRKTVETELVRLERLGQKKNGGYYDYDENRQRTLSPLAMKVIAEIAAENEITQVSSNDEEILSRLLYPIVNEGAKVLDEGIAIRSSDIDIACIKGYNWPAYTGGPMYWANTIGLDKVLSGLQKFEQQFGEDFAPSPYLLNLVKEGKQF